MWNRLEGKREIGERERGKEHGRERQISLRNNLPFLSLMIVFINTLNSIVQILRMTWYF
jgi:hypothetical protein